MKRLIIAAVAASGLLAAPMAQAGSDTDRATGGGQVLINTRGGAGDTIAFTARGTETAARGEVQYVDRTATGQTVYHGTVICLRVEDNVAKIAGRWDRPSGAFEILVVDNGQGAAASDDMIALNQVGDPTCDEEQDDDDGQTALARGNAQVYDAPDPE